MAMNRQRLHSLAHLISKSTMEVDGVVVSFDMSEIMTMHPDEGDGCGTAGCIAGWAAVASGLEPYEVLETHGVANVARDWLGLDRSKGSELFFLQKHNDDMLTFLEYVNRRARQEGIVDDGKDLDVWQLYNSVTPEMAAAVLYNLAETGKVDWCKYAELSTEPKLWEILRDIPVQLKSPGTRAV